MPLLVVPLAPDETPLLTLQEWDALTARAAVAFEEPDHPLAARLQVAGVTVETAGIPGADDDTRALVARPGSALVVELARAGARVTSGAAPAIDDLTAAHGAYVGRRAQSSLGALALVMARLRSPDGCPWDREQSHRSLTVHLIEEAYEVLDAIDRDAVTDELEEELGDLLLQVFFHAQMAHDDGRFDVAGVADAIVSKLEFRHPHVFGEVEVSSAGEVVSNWEALKAREKERSGAFEGIPGDLSALSLAHKVQKRAAPAGFGPSEDEAKAAAAEALEAGDLGGALFWLVALARARTVDAEGALRRAVLRFRESLEEG